MRAQIFEDIHQERLRQNKLHPVFANPLAILIEEVGEIGTELQQYQVDFKGLRTELVQVAAVAVRWIEQLDQVNQP